MARTAWRSSQAVWQDPGGAVRTGAAKNARVRTPNRCGSSPTCPGPDGGEARALDRRRARPARDARRSTARPQTPAWFDRVRRHVPRPRRDPLRPRRRVLTSSVSDAAQSRASMRSVSAKRRARARSMLIAICGSSCSNRSKSCRLIARHFSGVAARTRPVCTSPSTRSDNSPMNSPATHSIVRLPISTDDGALLEDEQPRALLAGLDQDVAALDLERRRDTAAMCASARSSRSANSGSWPRTNR